MIRIKRAPLLVTALLLPLLVACSKRDKVVTVDDDDPEMVAAIAKARESLPRFWQVFENPRQGETGFALKVKIADKSGIEHFWASNLQRHQGKVTGTIDNDPNTVTSVKLGDRIEILEANVSDWLYMRDGKMVGNYTLRPLFKQMPAEEVEQLKKIMADP